MHKYNWIYLGKQAEQVDLNEFVTIYWFEAGAPARAGNIPPVYGLVDDPRQEDWQLVDEDGYLENVSDPRPAEIVQQLADALRERNEQLYQS